MGLEIVKQLVGHVQKVVIVDIAEPAASNLMSNGTVSFIKCDLSKPNAVLENLVPKLKQYCNGRNIILINNAGCHASAYIRDPSELGKKYEPGELVKRTFNVNFFAAVDLIEALFDNIHHVINIASVLSSLGLPALSDYGSSKSALTCYHESLHFEIIQR